MAEVKRLIIGLIKFAVAAVLLGVLIKIFVDNFGQIKVFLAQLDWRLVAAAAFVQAMINWAVYELWLVMVRKLGGNIGRRAAWKTFFLPYAARYIPGKVALVAGKVHYCAEEGVPIRTAAISIMLENGLIIIAGLFLASLSSFYLFGDEIPPTLSGLFLLAAVIFLICLHPAVLRRVLNVPMRLFRRQPIRTGELLSLPTLLIFFSWLRRTLAPRRSRLRLISSGPGCSYVPAGVQRRRGFRHGRIGRPGDDVSAGGPRRKGRRVISSP